MSIANARRYCEQKIARRDLTLVAYHDGVVALNEANDSRNEERMRLAAESLGLVSRALSPP